jgi:DNA-binding transcriptional LysR family regulator
MRGTQFAELSAFVAVAEQKSFTRAAQQLGISTGTLSQTIRSLEDGLGVRLLNRTTRSVGLTAVGERLLKRLRPVLDDYEGALESINDFRDRPCGLLRLTVVPPASEFVLAPLLGRFLAQYSDIKLEVLAEPALQDIVAERFDAGIRVGQRVERDMIAVRVSIDIRFMTLASPAYLARHGTPVRPQDLRDHNCIRFRFPSTGIMPWRFEKKGKRVEVAVDGSIITSDPRLGVSVAADGGGIFYTAQFYAEELVAQRKLISILEDWAPPPDAFYLYYPSRRQNPAALQALIEFLKANLRDGGGARTERRLSAKA